MRSFINPPEPAWLIRYCLDRERGRVCLTSFYEKTLMLGSCNIRHVKDDILEAGCLCSRPVDSCCFGTGWDRGQIDDEIPDLPPKDIGRCSS